MDPQKHLLEDGVTEVTTIHFVYLSPAGTTAIQGQPLVAGKPTWKIACVPNLIQMAADRSRAFPWHRSDDSRAVTCPLCKETAAYKAQVVQLRAAGAL